MKLSDIAALLAVRNHIGTVINDRNTSKNDIHDLIDLRTKLDKKFIKIMKIFDVDSIGADSNLNLGELVKYSTGEKGMETVGEKGLETLVKNLQQDPVIQAAVKNQQPKSPKKAGRPKKATEVKEVAKTNEKE